MWSQKEEAAKGEKVSRWHINLPSRLCPVYHCLKLELLTSPLCYNKVSFNAYNA